MAVETRVITDRSEWLRWRREDVTASVAAALIGLHEYITPLALYSHYVGTVPFDNTETPPMRRGRLLEDVARKLIQEEHPEWVVLPASDYIRDTEKRLGCTPDVYVHRDNHLGIVEIKSVQPHIFEQRWRNEEGGITPPMAATIQALLTKHLTGADFAYVAALRVSHGLELDMVEIPDSPKLIKRIEDAAPLFWESVKRKEPPPADFATDAELVIRMHAAKATPDKVIDLSADNELPEMADRYRELAAIAKAAEDERKIIKARLLDKLGDAEFVLRHGDVFATARLIKKDPYKVEPKPYRDVRFKGARSQEEAA